MLFIIPLEAYEERYTEQWSRWIPQALQNNRIDFKTIEGEALTNKIETGKVLDVYGTHYYKFSQLQKIVAMLRNNEIKDGDTLWFADLWFPGIEALAYIRDMTGVNFLIKGVLHAGTWDEHDFTYLSGMRSWGKHIEEGWLNLFDEVFLGSEFHKKIILDKNDSVKAKLTVTGIFFDYKEVFRHAIKENIVVFPHRPDKEKRPELFDRLAKELSTEFPNWRFLKTKDVTKTKEEYFELLGKSKIAVSFAEQETFGYAMLEAIANGCIPIVPNTLSYATMPIYKDCYFESYTDAKEKIRHTIKNLQEINQKTIKQFDEEMTKYLPDNIIKKMFL